MSGAFGSSQWMYAIDDGYDIGGSLRFNDNDNAYLKRDLTQDGNRKTYTISLWFKIANLGTGTASNDYRYLYADGKSSSTSNISLSGTDFLSVAINDGSSRTFRTNRLFRDVSAWYHIVVAVDTTQVTDTDRVKIYINGQQETSFSLSSYPTKDNDTTINKNGNDHLIGKYGGNTSRMWDGYIAEFNLIDGTALAPTSFGEDNNGQWRPIEYSGGSYGNNGFYLSFADSSAIGDDLSGNGNDFTANNLVASDVVPDSPTNNFATLNPLAEDGVNIKTAAVLSEGNLVTAAGGFGSGTPWGGGQSTIAIPTDKKIYCEMLCSNATGSSWFGGVSIPELNSNSTGSSNTGQIAAYNRSAMINGVETDYGSAGLGGLGVASLASGDILQIAVDGATGKVWFGRNGTYFKSPSTDDSGTTGDPAAGTNEIGTVTNTDGKPLFIVVGGNSATVHVNFGADSSFAGQKTSGSANAADGNGNGDFYYTPPTDYVCLASSSLSEPAIGPNSGVGENSDDYFNTVLWSGNSTNNRSITTDHATDFVWIKKRGTTAQSHVLADSVRGTSDSGGTGNVGILASNSTGAESTNSSDSGIASFDSTGFTIGAGSNTANADAPYQGTNASSHTYVGWSWKAGGTAVSNTDGSITSSVSAAPDAGFSVGTFTGNATAGATIGHSLGEIPEMVIVKRRSNARDWAVYHKDQSATPTNAYLLLNSTAAVATGNTAWNNGTFTTDVFTIGSHVLVNASGDSYVFYAFKGIDGYSKVGSYVANASADGTFVYTGFSPAFVLLKNTVNGAVSWQITDSARSPTNVVNDWIQPNLSDSEDVNVTTLLMDYLSNGFKLRNGTYSETNAASGNTFIYLAFAEAPFKYANAR